MQRTSSPASNLVVLLLLSLAALSAPAFAQPSISGFVLADEDGAPVEGATVSLLVYSDRAATAERYAEEGEAEERLARTRSDADGFYRLEAPEIGLYLALIEARGRRPLIRLLEPLLESETLPTARLPEARRLLIEARDEGDEPIAGAYVVVTAQPEREQIHRMRRLARSGWQLHRHRALTGEDGTVTLDVGPWERVAVAVAAEGFVPFGLELSSDEQGEVDASLGPGLVQPIRLVDEQGSALEDVLVRHGNHLPLGRSDEEGRLMIEVGEEPLQLIADAGELHGERTIEPADLDAAEQEEGRRPEELELRLEAPQLLSGQVLDSSRRPIAGALVWSMRLGGEAARTDNRGTYTVEKVAGRQWLAAAAAGFRGDQAAVEADAGAEGPTLILEPAASVAGRVVDAAGEPIGGAEIEAHEVADERRYRPSGQGISQPDGRFHVSGLELGKGFELKVRARGYVTVQTDLEPLEPGEARSGLEIRLQPALVAVGRVVDESENPIAGASVELAWQPKSTDFRAMFRHMRNESEPNVATTDGDGRFRIEDLDPSTYRLTATAAGFAPAKVPGLEIEEGAGTVDLGTVVVVPGVELTGRVTDPDGTALAEVEVKAAPNAGGMAAMMANFGTEPLATRTDQGGRFVFGDLQPEQPLELRLEKDGWAAEPADAVAGTEVDLVMQPAASLVVDVRDAAGGAVEGAMVMAKTSGGGVGVQPFRRSSTASGRAEIENLLPGRYDIEVTVEGYRPFSRAGVEITTESRPMEVVVDRGLSFSGTVVDAAGAPVPEAFVRIQESARGISFGRRHDRTDGDGRFTLEGLDPGPQEIRVTHDEHGETGKRIDVQEGMAPVEVRYLGGATVSGLVLDVDTGAGVGGATVQLRAAGQMGGPFFGRGLSATTGADGSFEIKNVPAGAYTPAASHEEYAMAQGEAVEVGELPVSGVVLEMGGGETIVGRVLGLAFDELAGTSVVAISPQGGFLAATLDYEGRFRLESLAPGDWMLQATGPDGRQAAERVQLAEGDGEVEVEIEFGGGLTVRGTVMRAGSPLSGVEVQAINGEKFVFGQGRTDSEGRFEIDGLETGTYRVLISRRPGEILRQEEIVLEGDDEWFFDLQAAAVAGRVTGVGGQGISGVAVSLRPVASGETQSQLGWNPSEVASDSFGAFEFGEVAAGSYRLIATKAGYAQAEQSLELGSTSRRDLELVLERSAGVTVRPLRAGGGRPTQVSVAVLDAANQPVETGSKTVGEDGLLRLDSLPAGEFTLLVAEPGGPSAEMSIRSPGDAGAVTLPRGGVLRVEMPDLFVEGERAEIEIRRSDGRLYRSVEEFSGWARWLRGSEHRQVLPAGSYTVEIEASEQRRWQFPITVTAGGETTLRVP